MALSVQCCEAVEATVDSLGPETGREERGAEGEGMLQREETTLLFRLDASASLASLALWMVS